MEQLDTTATSDNSEKLDNFDRNLYLTFHLNGENYGLAIHYVTEIIGIQAITSVPSMPESIKGIINLRGRVIPVMDVRLRFGFPERSYDERTCIIVVHVPDQTIGLIVDRVEEVVNIPPEQIESAPEGWREQTVIDGMGKINDQVKILLDVGPLVSTLPQVMDFAVE